MNDSDTDLIMGTNNAEPTIGYDDETILWEGRPSQLLNAWNYFCCAGAILFSAYCLWYWHSELYIGYEHLTPFINIVCQTVILGGVFAVAYFYFDIWYERTIITRNKIQEEKGITRLFRRQTFCEISDIRDIESPAPGILLGMFNLANLIIETNDDDQQVIVIRAIKDRDDLVSKLLPIWRELKQERRGYMADL